MTKQNIRYITDDEQSYNTVETMCGLITLFIQIKENKKILSSMVTWADVGVAKVKLLYVLTDPEHPAFFLCRNLSKKISMSVVKVALTLHYALLFGRAGRRGTMLISPNT